MSARWRLLMSATLTLALSAVEVALAGLVALLTATLSLGEIEPLRQLSGLTYAAPLVRLSELSFGSTTRGLILSLLTSLVFTLLIKSVLTLLYQWHSTSLAERIGGETRARALRLYQRAPYLRVEREGLVELQFNIGASSSVAAFLSQLLHLLTYSIMLLSLIVGLLWASPQLTAILIILMFAGGGGLISLSKRALHQQSEAVMNDELRLAKLSHAGLHGLREMKLYQREEQIYDRFVKLLDRFVSGRVRQQLLSLTPALGLEIIGASLLLVSASYLVYIEGSDLMRLSSTLGFVAAASWRGLPLVNRILSGLNAILTMQPYLDRVTTLLASEEVSQDQGQATDLLSLRRDLTVRGLTLSYLGVETSVLKNVSFTVHSGQRLAIVGRSGAGKSSLAKLLSGLVSPSVGEIESDGSLLTAETQSSWFNQVGYVSQRPYLFDLTIGENIALSTWGEEPSPSSKMSRLQAACEFAEIDFIDDLERGIDTVLGEEGTRLSGGQAQRVAIARALYHQPKLLILDEVTSALDERIEQRLLDRLLADHNPPIMVILITHQLEVARRCDLALWLEGGEQRAFGEAHIVLDEYQRSLSAEGES